MYDEKLDFEQHDREVDEMIRILGGHDLQPPENGVYLDVGGGLGMHVWKLVPRCSRMFVTDIVNYSTLLDGQFLRLYGEKQERNNRALDLAKVHFVMSDAMKQVFRDEMFDFIFSFNAMEHIPQPMLAFREVIRMLKPGGVFFLQFDPIWMSPAGNHFSHRVPAPWAHLLRSDAEFVNEMRGAGADEAEVSDFLGGMNRLPFQYYQDMIQQVRQEGEVLLKGVEFWASDRQAEPRTSHPNFERLLSLGYSEAALIVRGMLLCGRKVYKGAQG